MPCWRLGGCGGKEHIGHRARCHNLLLDAMRDLSPYGKEYLRTGDLLFVLRARKPTDTGETIILYEQFYFVGKFFLSPRLATMCSASMTNNQVISVAVPFSFCTSLMIAARILEQHSSDDVRTWDVAVLKHEPETVGAVEVTGLDDNSTRRVLHNCRESIRRNM